MQAYDIVRGLEEEIAKYAGAKYGVAVESCTAALFLCCKRLIVKEASIPKYTYPGVACSIINAGGGVKFNDHEWSGVYELQPHGIYDSALRFKRGMYIPGSFYCLSFHAKKHLPIGRGGMILTENKISADWFRKARFDGRNECALKDDTIDSVGWNMYLTPEQAARGLMLFEAIKDKDLPDLPVEEQNYPDLSTIKAYR